MVHKLKAYKTLWSLDYSTESARGTVQYVLCTCTRASVNVDVNYDSTAVQYCTYSTYDQKRYGLLKTLLEYSSYSSISIYLLKIVHSTVHSTLHKYAKNAVRQYYCAY
jgi:hypothetical protein